jgi:Na+-transporting methylmalonyl-CoA/oxaloacetate decarboxylase gamma subunit
VAGLVFSVAVVFAFPLLLLVALYVIPTLVNRHSRTICSKDYRELITATPHLSIATTGKPRYLVMILGAVFTAILWRGSPLF